MAGKDGDAREYYDKAIALTRNHAYLNDEALAQERAGAYYLARGQQQIAALYIRNAHYALLQWGATAKMHHMEQHYPWLTADEKPIVQYRPMEDTISQSSPSSRLDFASIIKASQAISDELALDVLLAKLMRIVIENAGAERGLLLLKQGSQWRIQAEGIVDQHTTRVLQSLPVGEEDAPLSIINYVIHTGESVVIHNAPDDEHFMHDPYIQQHHPHAVLCMPMIHQTQLIGLLYLENTITIGAFTATRIEILSLLCSQAAISIENARLYSHMEDLVAARTTDLERTNAILHEEIMERKRAEEMLLKARDELEIRVQERTAELAETNRSLQSEIAERMRTEAHLHHAREAAEAANRTKSIFLANMSHELRTPLNAILGFTQLMEREQTLLPKHQDYMRIIARSGEHLLAVINDILEMSKIEAGLTILNEQSVDVQMLIKTMYDMFALRARKKETCRSLLKPILMFPTSFLPTSTNFSKS
ncbi:MAG: GAF domain-containing protein [Chloroflexaceae bacterium]|nr:GAF domain-containing protein [Chloroflexaceae bacterium]